MVYATREVVWLLRALHRSQLHRYGVMMNWATMISGVSLRDCCGQFIVGGEEWVRDAMGARGGPPTTAEQVLFARTLILSTRASLYPIALLCVTSPKLHCAELRCHMQGSHVQDLSLIRNAAHRPRSQGVEDSASSKPRRALGRGQTDPSMSASSRCRPALSTRLAGLPNRVLPASTASMDSWTLPTTSPAVLLHASSRIEATISTRTPVYMSALPDHDR